MASPGGCLAVALVLATCCCSVMCVKCVDQFTIKTDLKPLLAFNTTWPQAVFLCNELGRRLPEAKTSTKYWRKEIDAEKNARRPSYYELWTNKNCTYMHYIDTVITLTEDCTKQAYFQCKIND